MNASNLAELFEKWMAAKKAADDCEARYNALNPLRRGDDSAEIRSEGAWYEIDRLRTIELEAEERYNAALHSGH